MKTIIKTCGLSRDFTVGREIVHAVKDVSIEINEGSLTILRGRSGSGKTTLINLLGLIDAPTSGGITILDKEVAYKNEDEMDTLRKNLFSFVFQSGALVPNMTVYENIELVLRLAKVPFKLRKSLVDESLTKVGLVKKANQYPDELSGGEIQRVGIARAIVNKPKVIFADEPTSALDVTNGLKVVKLFKEIIADEGTTFVMATHDPKLVPMADYVYNLKDGEIVNE